MTIGGEAVPVMIAGQAWRMFTVTAVSVAELRCRETGQTGLAQVVAPLRDALSEEATADFDYWDDGDDPASLRALEVLIVEMALIAFKYRDAVPDFEEFELSDDFDTLQAMAGPVPFGNPLGDEAIEDFATVTGSIEKLFEKLPKWMKRIMEVTMEVLKLTRGLT